ncbi:MAG: beta-lactamase family protein [Planctomycetes bacterium]|nr:beta-lactamase family protein [Planctomycetota bacterium]
MSFLRSGSLLFALGMPLLAQDAGAAPDALAAHVDKVFARCTAATPGAVVLVARGGDVLLQRAYGLADLERSVPLTVDSVLDIGSTSKQFTAACVLLLVADGKLALADPVSRHVPGLPDCFASVTLRHLLLHTSGIPDYIDLMLTGGAHLVDRTTAEHALAALAKVAALEFATGSKWQYSNSNYFLLAQVVERAAKRPLSEFAAERIFTPLGMASTHVHDDSAQLVPRRALSFARAPRGSWRWEHSNWEQTGDGAVFTTVGDLLRWARNFGSGAVGGDALRDAMARPGTLDDGTAIDYGTGLVFGDLDGVATVSHGGAWAAYRAELLRVPSADLVVICLCNRDDLDPSTICAGIAKVALAR